MGEPIRTKKGKLAGRGKHDTRLGRVVQFKKSTHLSSAGKKSTKSKEVKRKKNGSKKSAYCRQSVEYMSWWKQGNVKMAMSEDRTSCWVHKDLTVTTKQIQALLTAARAPCGKDECQVRLTAWQVSSGNTG